MSLLEKMVFLSIRRNQLQTVLTVLTEDDALNPNALSSLFLSIYI